MEESQKARQCCGCSCHVCAEGHNTFRPMSSHTSECFLQFMEDQDGDPND